MYSGLTAPTIGSVQYEGMDVLKNMKMFRKYLGLCPQENRVITYLTVVDHLWLFSKVSSNTMLFVNLKEKKSNTHHMLLWTV